MSENVGYLGSKDVEETDDCCKSKAYFISKRFIDVVGALVGIILTFIPCLIVALLIKLESKGPVFFVQRRVGKDGEEFDMYKFRSMVVDAEEQLDKLKHKNEMSGPMFKMKEDPRITKIGKYIRKTSIDELPQLFNVLKGDMSLVGPRPSLPREVIHFNDYHKLRLKATPGLTCYWQISGRNDIDFDEWMELDIKYYQDRSLILDIRLIMRTARVLLGDRTAC